MGWTKLEKFPNYEINEFGSVRDRISKEELEKHPIGETYYFVMLDRKNDPKIRVVASLMKPEEEE